MFFDSRRPTEPTSFITQSCYHAEIQGTNSEKRYKGVVPRTSDSLFSVTLGAPTKAYIFESAIDLLSFRQLANQQKIQNSVLVSMASLKPKFSENALR